MTRSSLPRRGRGWLTAVAWLAATVALAVSGCGGAAPAQSTTTVERGTVSVKASASGALASISSQNLGFPKGAQLKEINVKVGDTVRPGQVLARLDDFAFQQQLNQQQSQLNNQQAMLNKLLGGNTVQQAQRSLDQSEDTLDATERNVDAQQKLDSANVKRAEVADDNAQRQQEQAARNLSSCRTSVQPMMPAVGGSGQGTPMLGMPAPSLGNRQRGGVLGGNSQGSAGQVAGGNDPCASQAQALSTAQTNAIQTRTTLVQARKTKKVDETQGQVSIESARQTVVTNRNNLDTAKNNTPADIDAQRAQVANAAAAVALARRDVQNAVLYAPVAGTVASINGAVNEFIGPETALTSQAPGSNASIPGVGAAATSQQNQVSVSTNGSANGGTFMVLNNVDTFQVVVPFEESDAAKVTPNLPVEVTFDAIPDLTRKGKVVAVAPTGTDISGVTNYYATIVLTETDPRLRDGQTAEAGVLTSSKDNVLVVPNNAVTKQGGQSFVSVPGADGQPVQVPFQPGLVGDDKTEVLSGLREGQQILLPQVKVTPTPGGGGGGPRGGGN